MWLFLEQTVAIWRKRGRGFVAVWYGKLINILKIYSGSWGLGCRVWHKKRIYPQGILYSIYLEKRRPPYFKRVVDRKFTLELRPNHILIEISEVPSATDLLRRISLSLRSSRSWIVIECQNHINHINLLTNLLWDFGAPKKVLKWRAFDGAMVGKEKEIGGLGNWS